VSTAGWRTAARVARREARRARGRTALVLAMIAVPVLFLSFAAVSYDMFRLSTGEQLDRDLGTADAAISWQARGPIRQEPTGLGWGSSSPVPPRDTPATEAEVLAKLPPGTRVIADLSGQVPMRTAAGTGSLPARGIDAADPLARGIVTITAGRAPAGRDEVALTSQAAGRLGASIGDTVRSSDGGRAWRVVGTVELPESLEQMMVFHPDGFPGATDARWLADTPQPLTWDQVKGLNRYGIVARSRAVVLNPPPASEWPYDPGSQAPTRALGVGALIAGLGAIEIVLLAGPAFAVGARRRQRDLALVAANGGTPAHLRRIVLADGIVLGGVAAVAGVVLGVAAAFLARPLVEQNVAHARAGGYRVYPLALLGIAAAAVLTGLLAALVPAFVAARQNVVDALSGRRGTVRSRRRWVVVGLAAALAGAAVAAVGATRVSTNLILAGVILGELGLVVCTPALVGLISRVGRLLPLAPRIALRDTARNRSSAAPAISAVMAAVAGAVAIGVFLVSDQARQEADYIYAMPPGQVGIAVAHGPDGAAIDDASLARIESLLRDVPPVTDVVRVNAPGCPTTAPPGSICSVSPLLPPERQCPLRREPTKAEIRSAARDERCRSRGGWSRSDFGWQGVVDDGTALAVLTGASGDDLRRAAATLRAGGVVVADARLVVDGRVTLVPQIVTQDNGGGATAVVQKNGGAVTGGSALPDTSVPAYVLRSGTALPGRAVISPAAAARVGFTAVPGWLQAATAREPTAAEVDRLDARLRTIHDGLAATVERGPDLERKPTLLVLAAAAGLITLGAAGIATGLAAADGRADLSTLAAVGASPRVRRVLSLSQSGVISGLGAVLGVAAGLGASFAVLTALNRAHRDLWPAPQPYPLAVPWTTLAIVFVVPVVAMLGAGLLTRSRLPIERRLG
jgi:putative ABC transport system permease protein